VGGLVGRNISVVTDSFWDKQTSGQTTSSGGTGMTTAEMKTPATFSGWDAGIWELVFGSYPQLQWQP
ncbi:MAG: peptidase M26, partial [Desulfobulbaceae bacterium]|nr:peptidase M26 [Desulfobulbaceae bacterium]